MVDASNHDMIVTKGLTKYYGAFVAIKDISFSIPRGQIVAFLGPNGAGKSTTMKILSGFLSASDGSATIAGLDINRQRLDVARKLGYLPENGPLYENMTPLEFLKFSGEVRGITGTRMKNRVEAVVDFSKLTEVLEKPIGKLSRGYRQRVGLAVALLHDPEVLIMDEPTAGLDPNQIKDFRSNIGKLGQSKTILISTHILQEAEAIAQRVLLISSGRMVFDGTPAELRQQGSMEEAFYKLTDRSAIHGKGGQA